MKVRITEKHEGEGTFPTFEKGTAVKLKERGTHYLNWYACDIKGHQTYVPDTFVIDGKLSRDYNPTELVQEAGDIVEVHEIIYSWLIATNQNGVTGWVPAEKTVSVEE